MATHQEQTDLVVDDPELAAAWACFRRLIEFAGELQQNVKATPEFRSACDEYARDHGLYSLGRPAVTVIEALGAAS